jgi:hypothetical protein
MSSNWAYIVRKLCEVYTGMTPQAVGEMTLDQVIYLSCEIKNLATMSRGMYGLGAGNLRTMEAGDTRIGELKSRKRIFKCPTCKGKGKVGRRRRQKPCPDCGDTKGANKGVMSHFQYVMAKKRADGR